jgi:hypothetical protein
MQVIYSTTSNSVMIMMITTTILMLLRLKPLGRSTLPLNRLVTMMGALVCVHVLQVVCVVRNVR